MGNVMNDDKMTISDLARLMQGEFLGLNKRLDGLETDVKEMKTNSNELFSKLDKFISLYEDSKQEMEVLAGQVRRLEVRVAKLEGGH